MRMHTTHYALSDLAITDLPLAILHKVRLNAIKYPVDQAAGSPKKYTAYAHTTGIDATANKHAAMDVRLSQRYKQHIASSNSTRALSTSSTCIDTTCTEGWSDVTLEDVRGTLHDFVHERAWQVFHTPRSLVPRHCPGTRCALVPRHCPGTRCALVPRHCPGTRGVDGRVVLHAVRCMLCVHQRSLLNKYTYTSRIHMLFDVGR